MSHPQDQLQGSLLTSKTPTIGNRLRPYGLIEKPPIAMRSVGIVFTSIVVMFTPYSKVDGLNPNTYGNSPSGQELEEVN